MSVNHNLLPITDEELASLLKTPEAIRDLIDVHRLKVQRLGEDGLAIVALTASSRDDLLSFIVSGAPGSQSGWIGEYVEERGRVVKCQVDMGYGPASYYRNHFLIQVARKLLPITVDEFARRWDPDLLERNHVYPGGWHNDGAKELLLQSFRTYRACVLAAAESGQHLLVWCN